MKNFMAEWPKTLDRSDETGCTSNIVALFHDYSVNTKFQRDKESTA